MVLATQEMSASRVNANSDFAQSPKQANTWRISSMELAIGQYGTNVLIAWSCSNWLAWDEHVGSTWILIGWCGMNVVAAWSQISWLVWDEHTSSTEYIKILY